MSQQPRAWRPTPTEVVSQRVRELRTRHGWSAQALADRCAQAGVTGLDRSVLAKLESGARASVTVDELVGLALVLDVSPADLLVPPSDDVEHHRPDVGAVTVDGWRVTSTKHVDKLSGVRRWLAGLRPLPGQDQRFFLAERPGVANPDAADLGNVTGTGLAVMDELGPVELLSHLLADAGIELRKIAETSTAGDDDQEGRDDGQGQ